MYAHITTMHLFPSDTEETIRIYKQEIIPLVQRQQGCRLITLLTSSSNDQVIAIGWWEKEEDLLAGQNDNLYQQSLAQINSMLLTLPTSASYLVNIEVAPI